MTISRRELALFVPAALATPSALAASANSDRRGDQVRRLRDYAEKTHPRGPVAAADPAWRDGWERLANQAEMLTPEAFIMRLKAQLAWFEDGHTTIYTGAVQLPGFELDLPLSAHAFFDGYYVTAAKDEAAPLIGEKILRIDGVPIAEIFNKFARIWPANNIAAAHHEAYYIMKPAVLRGAELVRPAAITAPVAIDVELGGKIISKRLIPRKGGGDGLVALSRTAFPIERARPADQPNFLHRSGDALIIAFDRLGVDRGSIIEFVRQAFGAMENDAIERVVLDLRRNDGGDNFMGEALRKYLERSRFNRPGGLYVLTSGKTFSAAQNLTTRLERESWALIAGEPTGGSPNHYGDATAFEGHGYSAYVSTLPWFDSYPLDKRRWTMPDILVPNLFADWKAGRDVVMETVCAHKDRRSLDDLTLDRTLFFDRQSQKQEWKPFWR